MFVYGNIRSFILKFILGLLFLTLSVFLFGSLVSFDSSDPGFGLASNAQKISNWFGFWGAYISRLLFVFFNYSSYFFSVFFFICGLKLMLGIYNRFIIIKFLSTMFGVLLLNLSLTLINFESGFFGNFLNKNSESI